MSEQFTREMVVHPAFDNRVWDEATNDLNRSIRNSGAGPARLWMILRGERGAIVLGIVTGWMLDTDVERKLRDKRPYDYSTPIGVSISYHLYNAEEKSPCEWLGGAGCSSDGSYSLADEYVKLLVSSGSEAVWTRMEQFYRETIGRQEDEE